ncbi:MAG: histidine kinase, partial [Proteobacteria bacterium]|nr:histidine kinase [Pseudomonadota bacterium]
MLQRLLEGMYMPHGYCLLWEPWLVTLHAASDALTFLAYSAIPIAIWIFVARRPDLEMKGLARLFAAFILWCGLTHLFGLIVLWHPIYELQGLVKGVTAAVSVTTAMMIFPLIPKALAIPSPRQLQFANAKLELEIDAHRRTLAELAQARDELEQRVAERTKELQQATERFKLLFEYAPVAMVMVGPNGKVEQVNVAAIAMFEAKRDDLVDAAVEA